MGWQTTGDVAKFLAVAGDYLRRDRAANTVMLTVTAQLRVNPAGGGTWPGAADGAVDPAAAPLFGWWTGPGWRMDPVGGAFMQTPGHPLVLSDVSPGTAADLAQVLAGRPLLGVGASPEVATAFADAWRAIAGGQVALRHRERLYRLGALAWPGPPPDGAPRVAEAADTALLARWFRAFEAEAGVLGRESDHQAEVRWRLDYGGLTLWTADSRPAALAGRSRPVAGMVRIGPVYTPPERRGHGYASAVTFEVSRQALDAGADEVLLYTDLANPVSNSVYQRIGYRAVAMRVSLSFSAVELSARVSCAFRQRRHTGRHYVSPRDFPVTFTARHPGRAASSPAALGWTAPPACAPPRPGGRQ
jgi:GNAT superfamily N-acetyltransferase